MREQINRQKYIKDNIDVNLDIEKLIEEATWQVDFYERELVKVASTLHSRRVALKGLIDQKLNNHILEL